MSDFDRDIQRVIKRASEQGWVHSLTAKGHHQFFSPNKHDIIVTGGTPSDHRAFQNFMADMKRGGYVDEATTNLGEALSAAKGNGHMATDTPKRRGDQTNALRAILHEHPNGIGTTELFIILKARVPHASQSSMYTNLSRLKNQGEVENPEFGYWRLVSTMKHNVVIQPTTQAPVAGTPCADPQIADDLAVLDKALAALADIESVVRRNREVLHKLAEFKRMLNK